MLPSFRLVGDLVQLNQLKRREFIIYVRGDYQSGILNAALVPELPLAR
jgi:hypothetical protein